MQDYLAYYDLEGYLFKVVGPRFQEEGSLGAFDLFSIVIWKANRAKAHFARRLLKRGNDLERAARLMTRALHDATAVRERLRILIEDWDLRLPMASAILSALWPEEFSIYDVRVCGQLGGFKSLGDRSRFEQLWDEYQEYLRAVCEAAPSHMALRDKDRWLWGRSAAQQLEADIARAFKER